jgi:DNA (cytosine-5)-methyltransferase 1
VTALTAVSAFAGIGGFDLALKRAGVRTVAAIEIDKDCRSVLARHFPETHLFSDITEVTGDQLIAAGFVPRRGILAGGWPCTDLSVAGRREGLGGARSGLFWELVRLARELRPTWLLLENVPGLLSSVCPCPGDGSCTRAGRAVACGRHQRGKWLPNVNHIPSGGICPGGCMERHGGAMGAVVGALEQLGYGLCWRVLDAQYAGVPQRRDRLFFAGCLGDGARPVQVLLEPESSERDFAARRTSRPRASVAPDDRAHIARVAATLQGGGRRGHRVDAEGAAGGQLIAAPLTLAAEVAYAVTSRTSRNDREQTWVTDVATTVTGHVGRGPDSDMTSGYIVAAPLTAGTAASPGVNAPGRLEGGGSAEVGEPGDPAFAPRTNGGGSSYPMVASLAVAGDFSASEGVAQTIRALTAEGADASEDGTGRGTNQGRAAPGAVRRLTPLETERLQGFPDEWTRWKADGAEQSDSARYRQCGNAVAVPVVEWIARRLVATEAMTAEREAS